MCMSGEGVDTGRRSHVHAGRLIHPSLCFRSRSGGRSAAPRNVSKYADLPAFYTFRPIGLGFNERVSHSVPRRPGPHDFCHLQWGTRRSLFVSAAVGLVTGHLYRTTLRIEHFRYEVFGERRSSCYASTPFFCVIVSLQGKRRTFIFNSIHQT